MKVVNKWKKKKKKKKKKMASEEIDPRPHKY